MKRLLMAFVVVLALATGAARGESICFEGGLDLQPPKGPEVALELHETCVPVP